MRFANAIKGQFIVIKHILQKRR